MKPLLGDYIIIGLLLTVSISLFIFFNFPKNNSNLKVEIYVSGTLNAAIPIEKNAASKEYKIDSNGTYMTFLIENGSVSVIYSNCKNQVCVHSEKINTKGEVIACLPNQTYVKITGNASGNDFYDAVVG